MQLRIGRDGSPDSPNETHLVVQEIRQDGRVVRHLLCLRCRELIVATEGEESVHECDDGDDSGQ